MAMGWTGTVLGRSYDISIESELFGFPGYRVGGLANAVGVATAQGTDNKVRMALDEVFQEPRRPVGALGVNEIHFEEHECGLPNITQPSSPGEASFCFKVLSQQFKGSLHLEIQQYSTIETGGWRRDTLGGETSVIVKDKTALLFLRLKKSTKFRHRFFWPIGETAWHKQCSQRTGEHITTTNATTTNPPLP